MNKNFPLRQKSGAQLFQTGGQIAEVIEIRHLYSLMWNLLLAVTARISEHPGIIEKI
jgi:hypothetical protein